MVERVSSVSRRRRLFQNVDRVHENQGVFEPRNGNRRSPRATERRDKRLFEWISCYPLNVPKYHLITNSYLHLLNVRFPVYLLLCPPPLSISSSVLCPLSITSPSSSLPRLSLATTLAHFRTFTWPLPENPSYVTQRS